MYPSEVMSLSLYSSNLQIKVPIRQITVGRYTYSLHAVTFGNKWSHNVRAKRKHSIKLIFNVTSYDD